METENLISPEKIVQIIRELTNTNDPWDAVCFKKGSCIINTEKSKSNEDVSKWTVIDERYSNFIAKVTVYYPGKVNEYIEIDVDEYKGFRDLNDVLYLLNTALVIENVKLDKTDLVNMVKGTYPNRRKFEENEDFKKAVKYNKIVDIFEWDHVYLMSMRIDKLYEFYKTLKNSWNEENNSIV